MTDHPLFRDRVDAGRHLASMAGHLRGAETVIVGLPRGGVPVAWAVADELDAPLDVILVRKLGVPVQPELAMGAIGEDGVRVVDADIVRAAGVSEAALDAVETRERAELERRAGRYRAGRPRTPLAGKSVVVVGDGVATGSTARAACQVARTEGATRVVLAVPVAPPDWIQRLGAAADDYLAVAVPDSFSGVGQFYRDFSQTTDDEVIRILDEAATRSPDELEARRGSNRPGSAR